MVAAMLQVAHLLKLADEYQRASDPPISDTTLSFRVFADSKKLADLRKTADITTKRFNAAIEWFSANWPEGAEWPQEFERPQVAA